MMDAHEVIGVPRPRRLATPRHMATLRPLPLDRRAHRVVVLLAGIVVLSLADLVITLAYVQANWMMEANPIAAWIIAHSQSPWALSLFKSGTVGICVALLYRVRNHRSSEVAAWCALVVLTVMSIMWRCYADHFDDPAVPLQMALACDDVPLGMP